MLSNTMPSTIRANAALSFWLRNGLRPNFDSYSQSELSAMLSIALMENYGAEAKEICEYGRKTYPGIFVNSGFAVNYLAQSVAILATTTNGTPDPVSARLQRY